MSMILLAASARGLFIAMLIIMIVVSLLFGFIVFMLLKPVKKQPEAVDPNNVRNMLARRETALTVELMANKNDEAKKAELVNKLRRVKSAQLLVDELVQEEQAITGATEAEEKNRVKPHREPGEKPVREKQKPVAAEGAKEEQPSAPEKPAVEAKEKPAKPEKPAAEKAAKAEKPAKPAKPSKKKKDDMEFNPSLGD